MDPKHTPTIKDNQMPNTQSDTRKLAIFQNDSDFYMVHKKAEKIAIATYMITNFFASDEPLKWSFRKAVGELLKDTIALSSASLSLKDILVRNIVAKLTEIISLYEVAHKAGFIGEMNFTIIKSELNKMLELLDKRESSQISNKSISFDDSFFKVDKLQEEQKDVTHQPVHSWQNQIQNQITREQRFTGNNGSQTFTENKFVRGDKYEAKPATSFIKDNNILKDIKDKRQNIIIALVKKHRTLTIKGFTSVIKDCSEKTIQRELLALVAKGVLKKEGERRWSTYSLA